MARRANLSLNIAVPKRDAPAIATMPAGDLSPKLAKMASQVGDAADGDRSPKQATLNRTEADTELRVEQAGKNAKEEVAAKQHSPREVRDDNSWDGSEVETEPEPKPSRAMPVETNSSALPLIAPKPMPAKLQALPKASTPQPPAVGIASNAQGSSAAPPEKPAVAAQGLAADLGFSLDEFEEDSEAVSDDDKTWRGEENNADNDSEAQLDESSLAEDNSFDS